MGHHNFMAHQLDTLAGWPDGNSSEFPSGRAIDEAAAWKNEKLHSAVLLSYLFARLAPALRAQWPRYLRFYGHMRTGILLRSRRTRERIQMHSDANQVLGPVVCRALRFE